MKTPQKISRYPGIRSFEREEQALFFGRVQEIEDLYSLILAKTLIVLYAKSGIGKSSLLNAGIIPKLEKDNFLPFKIRLQNTTVAPVEAVKSIIEPNYAESAEPLYFDKKLLAKHTQLTPQSAPLWEFMRACTFPLGADNQPKIPALIFDQFEEFFAHDWEQQLALTEALADLVNYRLPERTQQQFRQIPRKERTREQFNWFAPYPVKIILAIRSDRLSFLDNMVKKIPTILQNRFWLKPLGEQQARQAIIRPAQLQGDHYKSPTFDYEESALQMIIDTLSDKRQQIESFQLQLVCQDIENKMMKK